MLVYTNGETELDFIASPTNLVKAMPHYRGIFESLANQRHLTDRLAAEQGHERQKGYFKGDNSGGMKVVARIPESLLPKFLALEPALLMDNAALNRFLKKFPIYRAYSNAQA